MIDSASAALEFLAAHRQGVLATMKRDGRPQLSNIAYHYADGRVRMSITDDRAKTRNARRDSRVSLHVTTPQFRPYLVAEGNAVVSPVTVEPGDSAGSELADVYEAIRGEAHPDWDEFYRAMVEERRVVLSFEVANVYGMVG